MNQEAAQKFHRVPLPWEEPKNASYLAVVIENLFTETECQELIRRSEKSGYEQALVNIGGGRQRKITDYRSSDRCILDDPEQAETIWQRILSACAQLDEKKRKELHLDKLLVRSEKPWSSAQWHAVGLNERLRCLRYGPGNFFKPHSDGCYIRGYEHGVDRYHEQSFVTCQLYLNEGFEGGATRFLSYKSQDSYSVIPKTGSVLLFEHNLYHEGSLVESGRKYAIRTDVMFTRNGPGHEYSRHPIVMKNPNVKKTTGASDSFDEMDAS